MTDFDWYWWQATDKWRHAYRGRRNDRITSDRSFCGKTVDLTTAPLTEFHPSCMDCWHLIKQLRGDNTYPPGLFTSDPRPKKNPGQES